MAAVTRLGTYGGPAIPYGSFAGKATQVIVETATETAGGRSKRRYPRWVVVDGHRYRVNSPEEERQLLLAMMDRAREVEATGTHEETRKAIKRQLRLKARIEKVDDSEAQWLEYLHQQDEEILLLL